MPSRLHYFIAIWLIFCLPLVASAQEQKPAPPAPLWVTVCIVVAPFILLVLFFWVFGKKSGAFNQGKYMLRAAEHIERAEEHMDRLEEQMERMIRLLESIERKLPGDERIFRPD